jgi:hypothetical protein
VALVHGGRVAPTSPPSNPASSRRVSKLPLIPHPPVTSMEKRVRSTSAIKLLKLVSSYCILLIEHIVWSW